MSTSLSAHPTRLSQPPGVTDPRAAILALRHAGFSAAAPPRNSSPPHQLPRGVRKPLPLRTRTSANLSTGLTRPPEEKLPVVAEVHHDGSGGIRSERHDLSSDRISIKFPRKRNNPLALWGRLRPPAPPGRATPEQLHRFGLGPARIKPPQQPPQPTFKRPSWHPRKPRMGFQLSLTGHQQPPVHHLPIHDQP